MKSPKPQNRTDSNFKQLTGEATNPQDKDDLICDIDTSIMKEGKIGKALCDTVRRETYDYLVNKGRASMLQDVLEKIDKIEGYDRDEFPDPNGYLINREELKAMLNNPQTESDIPKPELVDARKGCGIKVSKLTDNAWTHLFYCGENGRLCPSCSKEKK